MSQWVKDSVLSLLWLRSLLWHGFGFEPWLCLIKKKRGGVPSDPEEASHHVISCGYQPLGPHRLLLKSFLFIYKVCNDFGLIRFDT